MKRLLLTCLIFSSLSVITYPQDLYGNITVSVTGFKSEKGRAQVALFNSEKGFPLDPNYAFTTHTAKINFDRAITTFEAVPQGEYAICAIHDVDSDGEFDRNWIFLPGEGWGTSNDVGGYFGPGSYHESRFILDSTSGQVNVVIHN